MSKQDINSIISDDDDPIILNEKFNLLRAEYEKRRMAQDLGQLKPPDGLNEAQLALWHKDQEDLTAKLINEQITLISKLRRTTQGPARKGGKRAKAAPIDLDALSDELSKMA